LGKILTIRAIFIKKIRRAGEKLGGGGTPEEKCGIAFQRRFSLGLTFEAFAPQVQLAVFPKIRNGPAPIT